MKADEVRHLEWSQLRARLAQWLGLHFPHERRAELARGVTAAAQEVGLPDTASYVRSLLATPPDDAQLQQLARHLTIGETYFFRDRPLLDAVACNILPALIRARRGRDQRLRIWSAGCASGEEPYSLAILLHQLLPDLADWRLTITASDINPAALQKAVAGVYGEWSFRAVPPGLKEGYFQRRPDGRYLIAPEIRKLVNFACLNLVQDPQPSLQTDTNAMDIVFCRNVLMYFTPEQAASVIGKLHRALVDGGWLAVSPSETAQALVPRFEQVNFPGAFLYRKRSAAPAAVAAPVPAAPAAAAEPAAPAMSAPPPPEPRSFALPARALANEGRLAEALGWCDRWIAADKVDPAAHYLRAVVLMEQGEFTEAGAALRRALFLEPGFVLAHFTLGNLARRDGRSAEASRHFANTRRLLALYQAGDLLPEGEGLSAGRLGQTLCALDPQPTA